jgi:hypothetical protein
MRGVCALNIEAMAVLLKDKHQLNTINEEQQRQVDKHKGLLIFDQNSGYRNKVCEVKFI